jgi:hypothetical protein
MVKKTGPLEKERSFSVELKPEANLRHIAYNNNSREHAIIEGSIGELEHAEFVEDMVLEIRGRKGVVRIDISEDDVTRKEAGTKDPAHAISEKGLGRL